jgi:hypothetical protein
MNEELWQTTSTRPNDMLRHARNVASARKLALISCGCCRLIWNQLNADQRAIVMTVERSLDHQATDEEYRQAVDRALLMVNLTLIQEQSTTTRRPEVAAANAIHALVARPEDDGLRRTMEWVLACALRSGEYGQSLPCRQRFQAEFCRLFREIVGNPYLPRQILPAWLPMHAVQPGILLTRVNDVTRTIALGAREELVYHRMAVLADAVEEAGTNDLDLLLHLRDPEVVHSRGCWALDLILGQHASSLV